MALARAKELDEYYEKNKTHYTMYKYGSGRVSGLKQLWGGHEE